MMKDYYKILGIKRDADVDEIKKAFREKAKKYHPDAKGDKEDQDKLIEIQEAYEVLSDKKKREKYDKELKKIEKERRIEYPQEFYFEIVISPLEARYGKRINIEIPIMKRCPRCLGEVDPFCPICNGEGFLWDYYYKSLILPCGIRNGATIRFSLKDAGIDVWINLRVFISSFFI